MRRFKMPSSDRKPALSKPVRVLLFLALLYLFLIGIKILERGIKTAGEGIKIDDAGPPAVRPTIGADTATETGGADGDRTPKGPVARQPDVVRYIVRHLANPFTALAAGILLTVIVQSSSVTTATIVGLVGTVDVVTQEPLLRIEWAVPMVMGANIGTSVTSTLVAMGHMTRSVEFRRAFAGATVHDFFNLLTVAILLPLELLTGFLRHSAETITTWLPRGTGDMTFNSPIKQAVGWAAGWIAWFYDEVLGLHSGWLAGVLLATAIAIIIGTLYFITRNMRVLMAERIERWLNEALANRGMVAMLIGAAMTVAVQSSSITTSLLVPMFAAGVLSMQAGFPILVGSNIGTTVTALLAALVVGPTGMTIALVHLLFNCCGAALFVPSRQMRWIPIGCAQWLAARATENRAWVAGYLLTVFVVIPLVGMLIFR